MKYDTEKYKTIVNIILSAVVSVFIVQYTTWAMQITPGFCGSVCLMFLQGILCFSALNMVNKKMHVSNILFNCLLVYTLILYCGYLKCGISSVDTWQMYDMSRYVFKDFGYMHIIRQHMFNTPYEIAFPPIFPILMAFVNCFVDMGVMSGIFICLNCTFLLVAVLKNIADYTNHYFEVAVASTLFFSTSRFRNEVFWGGLSQLLGFLILAILIRIILNKEFTVKHCFLCSLVAGIGLMNRFDFAGVAALVVLLVPFNCYESLKTAFAHYKTLMKSYIVSVITMLAVCSPWIVYSLIRFGKVFVTDNGRRLINIPDTRPSTYFPDEFPAQTVFDDFSGWLIAFSGRAMSSLETLWKDLAQYKYIYFLIIIVVCIGICVYKKQIFRIQGVSSKISLGICLGLIIGQECVYILTGYPDPRYHMVFVFVCNVASLILIRRMSENMLILKRIFCAVVIIVTISMCIEPLGATYRTIKNPVNVTKKDIELNEQEKNVVDYLQEHGSKCLMGFRNEQTIDIWKTCSLVDTHAIVTPSNISEENAVYFVEDFNIDYLYSSDNELNEMLSSNLLLEETKIEHLYRLEIRE